MSLRNKLMIAGLMITCSVKLMGMQRIQQELGGTIVPLGKLKEIQEELLVLVTDGKTDLLDELVLVALNQEDRLSDDNTRKLNDHSLASITIPSHEESDETTTLIQCDGTMTAAAKILIRSFINKRIFYDGSPRFYISALHYAIAKIQAELKAIKELTAIEEETKHASSRPYLMSTHHTLST